MNEIKRMHTKFGINYEGPPRPLEKDEYIFRCIAMMEELLEYIDEVFDTRGEMSRNSKVGMMKSNLERMDLLEVPDLAKQFDALVDLSVFLKGACERHGFPYVEGYEEVMDANCRKELATSADQSKRGFSRDLIKPENWYPPFMEQFVYPNGLIVIEGPDGSGKTYLQEALAKRFNAVMFHHTWSEELDTRMYDYFSDTLDQAEAFINEGRLVIIDRLNLTEQIYSKVFRNNSRRWEKKMFQISSRVQNLNGLEIICCPYSKMDYLARFETIKAERQEMYGSMEQVYDLYNASLSEPGIIQSLMRWDFLAMEIDLFVEEIGTRVWEKSWGQEKKV